MQDLKRRPLREVPARAAEIWQEFLAPGAPSAINLDSRSYDRTQQNVREPGRYTFEDAQVCRCPYFFGFLWLNHCDPKLEVNLNTLFLCPIFHSPMKTDLHFKCITNLTIYSIAVLENVW